MASRQPPRKKAKTEVKTEVKNEVKTEDVKPETNGDSAEKDFPARIHDLRLKAAESVVKFKFNKKRVRIISKTTEFPDECQGVLYWMSRDQRVQDNWALLYAQKLALKMEVPLHVCFCLVPRFLDATIRHYNFMLKGLREVQQECKDLDISFHLLIGYAKDRVPLFVSDHQIGGVVCDFSPLRVPTEWVNEVVKGLPEGVPMCQVDAHNVVPCWEASPKLEYGARTIRKKINDQLPTYLTEFPPVIRHLHAAATKPEPVDWEACEASLEVDQTVREVDWAVPGTSSGLGMLEGFVKKRLKFFSGDRNDPTKDAASHMSPWYHFGQVAPQRGMLVVKQFRSKYSEGVSAYLEEGIVRRELSDNFCYYNPKYDSIDGTNAWAIKTLNDHKKDTREKNYTREQLERGQTYDDLWNAAQMQLVHEGKMHGFLRMYWAKKILEWTDSPERALADAIYLNDRYSLDGRDPNGYVGCMWSICGIHDQGWAERPVFGKIRYMNYKGCQRKFDVKRFVAKYRDKKFPC